MRSLLLFVATGLWSCGYAGSAVGTGAADGGSDMPDGGQLDAPPPFQLAPCKPDGSAASKDCFTLPDSWSVIAFVRNQTSICAAGLASVDVVEGAVAGGAACACQAGTVTTAPSCTGGKVGLFFDTDSSATCGSAGDPTKITNNPAGQCGTDIPPGVRPSNLDVKLVAPAPTGGNCTAPAVVHKENVTFAARGRACIPSDPASAGCVGNACTPTFAAPFEACLMASGAQSCPTPFTERHVVGTDVTFDCAACPSTLSATCGGTTTFYTDSLCTAGAVAIAADAVCRSAAGLSGNSYNSYRHAGMVASAACGPPGPAAPPTNVALVGERTICCPP